MPMYASMSEIIGTRIGVWFVWFVFLFASVSPDFCSKKKDRRVLSRAQLRFAGKQGDWDTGLADSRQRSVRGATTANHRSLRRDLKPTRSARPSTWSGLA